MDELAQGRRRARGVVAETSGLDAEGMSGRGRKASLFKGVLSSIRRIGR